MVGPHDEPVSVQDVSSEPFDREAEETWSHLLLRAYGIPFAAIAVVVILGYLALR